MVEIRFHLIICSGWEAAYAHSDWSIDVFEVYAFQRTHISRMRMRWTEMNCVLFQYSSAESCFKLRNQTVSLAY